MNTFDEPFVYRLTFDNRTSRDFVLAESALRRGRWYRGEEDNSRPVTVPAGKKLEAMGIWAPTGSRDGYDCCCVWADAEEEAQGGGSITVTITVPFLPGKNTAGLDVSGLYRVEGWTGISRLGRAFMHELTIREVLF